MRDMTLHTQVRAFSTAAWLAAVSSCASTTPAVAALAGRYELRSVNGRSVPIEALGGALGGDLVLTADGRATRVVRYVSSGVPGPIVHRTAGTYRLRGTEITLDLDQEVGPASTRQRQMRGDVQRSSILLRYPGPADRTVEELYVRSVP